MGKRENIDTKCQKVLELLIEAKKYPNDDFPIGTEFIRDGWRPMWWFRGETKGGDCADKRLRELRYKFGIPIEMKIHNWEYNGKKMRTPVYRLGCDPEEIDLKNIRRVKKEKYEQGVLI